MLIYDALRHWRLHQVHNEIFEIQESKNWRTIRIRWCWMENFPPNGIILCDGGCLPRVFKEKLFILYVNAWYNFWLMVLTPTVLQNSYNAKVTFFQKGKKSEQCKRWYGDTEIASLPRMRNRNLYETTLNTKTIQVLRGLVMEWRWLSSLTQQQPGKENGAKVDRTMAWVTRFDISLLLPKWAKDRVQMVDWYTYW